MYLPVPPQPDCAAAWRAAVRAVDSQSGHSAYNVIIDVADPTVNNTRQDPRIAVVDDFLGHSEKSVEAVANTIFPAGLYTDTARLPSSTCSGTRCFRKFAGVSVGRATISSE